MFGFDQFVYYEIILPILNVEKRDEKSTTYQKIRYQTNKFLLRHQEIKKKHKEQPKKYTKLDVKNSLKIFKSWRSIRNTTPCTNVGRLERKALYVRYADNWVLTLVSKKEAKDAKTKIAQYLLMERKMQLDDKKTKIINVSNGYTFLGFEVRKKKFGIKQTFTTQKEPTGKTIRMLKRTTSRQFTIEPHSDRILNRLKMDNFCNNNYEPIAKPRWLIYEEYDIVKKYSQIFRGIYYYYRLCKRLTRLNRISYLLQYSCACTLARRRNISLRKIFNKYGTNLAIQKTIKNTKGENVIKTVKFYTLTDLRRMQPTIPSIDR